MTSFFALWTKDEEEERPKTVNVPTARGASYHSAMLGFEHQNNLQLQALSDNRHVCLSDTETVMTDMLVACLRGYMALPNLEYYHILKMSGFLKQACDSRSIWMKVIESFKYRDHFEKKLPDLLLTMSDFGNSTPPDISLVHAIKS